MASTDLLLRIRADVADAQRSVDAVRKSLRQLDAEAKVKIDLSLDNLRAQVGKGIADLRAKFQEGFRDVSSGLLGDIAKNVGTIINPVGAATAAIAGLGAADQIRLRGLPALQRRTHQPQRHHWCNR